MAVTRTLPVPHISRFRKLIAFGVNDVLFLPSRFPFVVFDAICIFALFMVGTWESRFSQWGVIDTPLLTSGCVFTVCFEIAAIGLGFYDRSSRFRFVNNVKTCLLAYAIALLAMLSFVYFFYYKGVGRQTVIYGSLFVLGGILLIKSLFSLLLRRYPYRFTIIGASKYSEEIIRFCQSRRNKGQIYRYVPWQVLFPGGQENHFERLIEERIVDVVISSEALNNSKDVDFALECLQAKFRVIDEATFYQQLFERVPIELVSRSWILQKGIARRNVLNLAVKRWMDIVLSGIALVILSPVLLLISLSIRFSSPGPVFFVQPRQGRYSKWFHMYKFRTMRLERSLTDAREGFTKKDDDRVTWIGKILRPFHLDELPQLLNIFLGHMSLIGPRPEALQFAERMRKEIAIYDLRYLVRPGLSGHAQLNQGYAMDTVDDTKIKLSYDLYYLCNTNFWMDVLIILRTVFFLTKGAR